MSKDAYVHYEFVCVKCAVCGEESNGFVYKEHLTPEETITYIEEITGFSVRKSENQNHTEDVSFVNTGKGYSEGGLACQKCQGIQKEEVA